MFGKKSSKPSGQGGGLPPGSAEAPSKGGAKKGLFGLGKGKGGGKPVNLDDDPEQILASPGAPPANGPGSGAGGKKSKGGGPMGLVLPIVIVLALAAVAYFAYSRFFGGSIDGLVPLPAAMQTQEEGAPPPEAQAQQEQAAENAPENAPAEGELMPDELPDSGKALRVQPAPRPAVDCRGTPAFFGALKLSNDAQFSTNEPGIRGVILLSPVPNSDAVSKYQHQSWSSTGFFDAHVVDRDGYAYFAPSPRTGLGISEPTNQDHLYVLEAEGGVLSDYMTLPSAAPPSPSNPYGVLGLAYDCDSNSLYVTTVTGSTPENHVGRIYRIDLSSDQVAGSLENVDGFGAAVRTTGSGKQLVFGSPHDPDIRAVDLNADGNFQGEPRTVATLQGAERARQITFPNENQMIVQAVDFNLSNPDIPPGTQVQFQYDAASDGWAQVN